MSVVNVIIIVLLLVIIGAMAFISYKLALALKRTTSDLSRIKDSVSDHMRDAEIRFDRLSYDFRKLDNKFISFDPKDTHTIYVKEENRDVVELSSKIVIPTYMQDMPGEEVTRALVEEIAAQIEPLMDVKTEFDFNMGANVTRARIRVIKGDKK